MVHGQGTRARSCPDDGEIRSSALPVCDDDAMSAITVAARGLRRSRGRRAPSKLKEQSKIVALGHVLDDTALGEAEHVDLPLPDRPSGRGDLLELAGMRAEHRR